MQNRFHYSLNQKVQILNRTHDGRLLSFAPRYPKITRQQADSWLDKKEKMIEEAQKKPNKIILHPGPHPKRPELCQFLFQRFKDLRNDRIAVTPDLLIQIAEEEDHSIKNLTYRGKQSFIRRFMDQFQLSLRTVTGSSGFRVEQAPEEEKEKQEAFIRQYRQILIEKLIPKDRILLQRR